MMFRWIALTALLAATPLAARDADVPPGLTPDRVVLLMRHGVRPPTKSPPMPAGIARRDWPAWPVAPGYLTPHGAAAIRLLAASDRGWWQRAGLMPRQGCPTIRVVADSDQRTIATAEAYVGALVSGCDVAIDHQPQGVPDPRFSPIDEQAVPFDAAAAHDAVLAAAGPGGIAGAEARLAPQLRRLDTILCGTPAPSCGVAREPSGLAPPTPGKRPKLTGALDRASTAAQILLLEYAEGLPMREVGWGRATAADIAALAAFHATEFRLLARPRIVARANMASLAPMIAVALSDPRGARITMISGHDTNVASLGGVLDLHWQVPGIAADDPAPGGAIVFERLHDAAGQVYVRALYRSQTLDQMRTLAPLDTAMPYRAVLAIAGCHARGIAGLCTLADITARLTQP